MIINLYPNQEIFQCQILLIVKKSLESDYPGPEVMAFRPSHDLASEI